MVCKNLAIFMANDFIFHALATLVNPCSGKFCHSTICNWVFQPQHSKHFHGMFQLSLKRSCPTPHAPLSHWNLVCDVGLCLWGLWAPTTNSICCTCEWGWCDCVPQRFVAFQVWYGQKAKPMESQECKLMAKPQLWNWTIKTQEYKSMVKAQP
jgi:hypothetical protein